PSRQLRCAALSPGGRWAAAGDPVGRLTLWSVTDERVAAVWQQQTDLIMSVAFSPDGGAIATAGDDGTVRTVAIDSFGPTDEGVRLDEAEQVARHPPHLDLLGALGDAVAAVVPVDVLERAVPRVAQAAVHLHGPVGGLAAQPVGHVVAHGDLVGLGERAGLVHAPGGRVDQ